MADPKDAPRPSRRRFLTGAASIIAAGAAGAAHADEKNLPPNVAPWSKALGDGVAVRPYGQPSKFEKDVIRRDVQWLTASRESSVSFTPLHELDGIITPNGLCFERHHGGIAEVDPHDYRLMIHGLVDKPLIFTLEDLKRLPRVNRIYFLECAANSGMEWRGAQLNGCQYTHGMIHSVMYTGVPLKLLLEQAGVKPNGKWLLVEGGDSSGLDRSLPLEKALDDCLVAYRMNGEMLRPEQGYPVRLVVPGWQGNIWVKWLRRIEVGDEPWYTREETSKYTDLMPNGKARKFTFVMDAKSVITSPSPQAPIKNKGFLVISGLAWSGRGKVARVDVSIDGGRNWQTAKIDGPVLDKSLVRFYVETEWNGEPLLLQSRAMDETGYVQPTKDELRAIRGVNSIYHNNGIQTWSVKANGEVENVEVG
ncbi:sulfite dehydrogenase [Pseudolabrys sp. Root1462]|uniref:sulfite dehydrogenase n=1 Tax=Pseudolabrys sp. Root1462 TaxID=1736466 RepID=UPI0007034989|nr:sulfite dehydrogenase [Pseudolabrys sp. Root1462]KQZ00774.1 sulfite dehydrogenase [Pseudolabrys sp. Root1462]